VTTIDERVAAGAKWLDEHRPGWWQRIDLDTLNLGDPCQCVLGQLYGHFVYAPDEIWTNNLSFAGGFNAEVGLRGDYDETVTEFAALTAAWRTLIQARRDETAVTM